MKQNVNVLLIVCDQFRGDALSFANHPDVKPHTLIPLLRMVSFSQTHILQPQAAYRQELPCSPEEAKSVMDALVILTRWSGVISITWRRSFQIAAIRRNV